MEEQFRSEDTQWQEPAAAYGSGKPRRKGPGFAAGFLTGSFTTLVVCVLIVGIMLIVSGRIRVPGSALPQTAPGQGTETVPAENGAAGQTENAPAAQPQEESDVLAPNVSGFTDRFEQKIAEIDTYIDSLFIFPVDEDKIMDEAVKGYMKGLDDPYSAYYTKEEYQETLDDSDGNYVGIGVVVQQDPTTNAVKVMSVYPNSPAEAGGMQKDDIIIKVEGEDITSWELSEVVKAIRGVENTTVNVTVYRSGEEIDLSMVRKTLEKITVEKEMLEDKIGYIKLTEFDAVSVEQMRTAVNELSAQGMERLVLDLRDNPGGLLTSVVSISDDFLPQANIFYFMDKAGRRTDYNSEASQLFTGPMAVLINGNSASASEVLSGTLKDNQRAVLIGEQSFGKGIVQSFFPLSDGTGIKITTSHYFTPLGTDIHGVGITPDVEIRDDAETEEDEQLVRAIEEVKQRN